MKSYTVVLALLVGVLFMSLALRSDMEVTILRVPGMLYQKVDENTVSNLYTYQIVNKTNETLPIEIKVKDDKGTIRLIGYETLSVDKQDVIKGSFFVDMPIKELNGRKNPLSIEIWSNGQRIDGMKTSFNYK